MQQEPVEKSNRDSIKYQTIVLIIIVFIAGLIIDRVILNVFRGETVTFSTVDLLQFFITVVISSASIVLAIFAVSLGHKSEQMLVKRADESIQLQTRLFTQTTETLQKIASSTGVTEKRLQDMIPFIIDATRSGKGQWQIEEEVERKMRTSSNVSSEDVHLQHKQQRDAYNNFQKIVFDALSEREELTTVKIGDGAFHGDGLDLFDAIFKHEKGLFACSILQDENLNSWLSSYITRVAGTLFDNRVDSVLLVIMTEQHSVDGVEEIIDKSTVMFRGNPKESIMVTFGAAGDVVPKIQELEFFTEQGA